MCRTASLAKIAQRYGAIAAINGGYFDSYTSNPRKNPVGTIVTKGCVEELGNIGSLLGFDAQKHAFIGRVPLRIDGIRGDNQHWYAYWINRDPAGTSRTITVFTPLWGSETGLGGGVQVVVSGGVVRQISSRSVAIPKDGFVIYFRGTPREAGVFRVGERCSYHVAFLGDAWWSTAQEVIGCGPLLVRNGKISLDPVAEGFRDPKVLRLATARSAVGLTRDHQLLLVTTRGTVAHLASTMQALGAYQAMNLDGGASSGLWLQGRYITRPGRDLTSALLVLPR
jgi:exopolysaccharide biosynthesis protein